MEEKLEKIISEAEAFMPGVKAMIPGEMCYRPHGYLVNFYGGVEDVKYLETGKHKIIGMLLDYVAHTPYGATLFKKVLLYTQSKSGKITKATSNLTKAWAMLYIEHPDALKHERANAFTKLSLKYSKGRITASITDKTGDGWTYATKPSGTTLERVEGDYKKSTV